MWRLVSGAHVFPDHVCVFLVHTLYIVMCAFLDEYASRFGVYSGGQKLCYLDKLLFTVFSLFLQYNSSFALRKEHRLGPLLMVRWFVD